MPQLCDDMADPTPGRPQPAVDMIPLFENGRCDEEFDIDKVTRNNTRDGVCLLSFARPTTREESCLFGANDTVRLAFRRVCGMGTWVGS